MKKQTVEAVRSSIPQCVTFIERELTRLKVSKKERVESVLYAEDVLASVIEHADQGAKLTVSISSFMGTTSITMKCVGSEIDESEITGYPYDKSSFEPEEILVIDRLIANLHRHRITCKRTRNLNSCTITVEISKLRSLYLTLSALALGILFGLLLKGVSADAAQLLTANVFTPVYTVFLNALKLIVGPLVFFSIAESIAGFSDIRSLGRIAMKVFVLYLFTSLIAIGVGFGVSALFPIGEPSLQSLITDAGAATISQSSEIQVSIRETLIGIVPSNIINPFLKSDMLQIIFVAVMLGISTSMVDGKGAFAQFVVSANKVFSKFTAIIISAMPVAVFCSMAKMMIGMNFSDLLKVIAWVPSCYIGHLAMMGVYGVLLLVMGRYNPVKFYRLFMPAILTGFSTASSNAALPVSMKQCGEALKISPRICSFSIPMGATINMDGNCITLVITALFGARIFGIALTPSTALALIVAIMSLSLGAPGVPGGNLVCAAILMPILGVPAETISLVMGLYSLVGMSQSAANVTGDAVITTIVAKSEHMIGVD